MANRFWSSALIGVASLTSLMMFVWPLLISAKSADQTALAQAAFIGLMPVLLILVLVESGAGKLDSRRLAILGLLVSLNAVIRLLGAGVSGIETAFFLIIIGAYVFGPSFGFILGSGSLFVSALLSAGVGPWLPFQMMAAGLVGIGAGLIGKASTGRPLIAVSIYGFFSAFVYGALMTMWNWPFLAGLGSTVSYLPGGNLSENLGRFLRYELLTGGLAWDLGRAVTTVVLVAITGKTLLATLRRAANKAIVIPNV
jgi:energy-coupling factor transport system substrate-specific component